MVMMRKEYVGLAVVLLMASCVSAQQEDMGSLDDSVDMTFSSKDGHKHGVFRPGEGKDKTADHGINLASKIKDAKTKPSQDMKMLLEQEDKATIIRYIREEARLAAKEYFAKKFEENVAALNV